VILVGVEATSVAVRGTMAIAAINTLPTFVNVAGTKLIVIDIVRRKEVVTEIVLPTTASRIHPMGCTWP